MVAVRQRATEASSGGGEEQNRDKHVPKRIAILYSPNRNQILSSVPSDICWQRCRCCILGQQSLCFIEEKCRVRKRLVADVLPADSAAAVDHESPMQRLLLEIVVTPISPENIQLVVTEKRQRKLSSFVTSNRRLQTGLSVRTDREHRQAGLCKLIFHWREFLQLFRAVQAAVTQIENQHKWPAAKFLR